MKNISIFLFLTKTILILFLSTGSANVSARQFNKWIVECNKEGSQCRMSTRGEENNELYIQQIGTEQIKITINHKHSIENNPTSSLYIDIDGLGLFKGSGKPIKIEPDGSITINSDFDGRKKLGNTRLIDFFKDGKRLRLSYSLFTKDKNIENTNLFDYFSLEGFKEAYAYLNEKIAKKNNDELSPLPPTKNFSSEWTLDCKINKDECVIYSLSDKNKLQLSIKPDEQLSIIISGREDILNVFKGLIDSIAIIIDNDERYEKISIVTFTNKNELKVIFKIQDIDRKKILTSLQLSKKITIEANNHEIASFSLKNFTNAYKELMDRKNTQIAHQENPSIQNNPQSPYVEIHGNKKTFSYTTNYFIERYNNSKTQLVSKVKPYNRTS